jgi:hypothetical protein
MILRLGIAALLMALCVTVQAVGLTAALRWTGRRRARLDGRFVTATLLLITVAGWSVLLHLLQIAVWGLFYAWTDAMPDLHSALYFSAVTYTTTGYGDLVLPREWHLIGGVEAVTGILMFGLSTGFFFAIFARTVGHTIADGSTGSRE